MLFENIDRKIEENLPLLLADLGTLVSFDSELAPAQPGAPFGPEAARCLTAAETVIKNSGFEPRNHEFYALSADYDPALPRKVDILAHLDVVPAGNGWTVTDPFVMKQVGDRVYGRGTSDDKGPALCALYAMRAIRESGVKLKSGVRLILGSDEECGSRDLAHYYQTEKPASYSLSPDAEFPCINIEKGGLGSGFTARLPLAEHTPRLLRAHSGVKLNVVPDLAEAAVEGLSAADARKIADGMTLEGCEVHFSEENGLLQISVVGHTAHASMPQEGSNALTALLSFLAALPLSDAPLHTAVREIARLFPHGDCHGHALGVDLKDEMSGMTTLSFDMLDYSPEEGLSAMFDCRACLSANDQNTTDVIHDQFKKIGLTPMERTMYAPHHVPGDSLLVQTLLGVYEDLTGKKVKPLCIGGGTYVHHIENGIAFGCCDLELDTHMHGANEFMPIDALRFGCRAYARAIVRLCGVEE